MNRYFSVMRFEGEQSLAAEDDHLFSNQDYRMFSSYIRATIIEVSENFFKKILLITKKRLPLTFFRIFCDQYIF